MNKQVKPRVSRRICDYFIVGGCKEIICLSPEEKQLFDYPKKQTPDLHDVLHLSFEPEVIDRYPRKDHEDFESPAGIPLFCFPSGCHVSTLKRDPTFFSFVITSENGLRVLGCCLVFYEEVNAFLLLKFYYYGILSK